MQISIVGLGSVGTAAFTVLNEHHSVTGYDIDGRGEWGDVLQSEVAIVCVSTDGGVDGRLDMGNIHVIAGRLALDGFQGVMLVKSTLQPGTMDQIASDHPHLKMSYVPEFLREADALEWFRHPDRIVYSACDESVEMTLNCFNWVGSDIPRIRMSHMEAEFGKLAHNAFIATKVTFTCEVERIAIARGLDANAIMEVVWRDRRINNSAHLTPGLGGYGGKCVPKDTNALAAEDSDEQSLLKSLQSRGSSEAVELRGVALQEGSD